MAWVQGRQERVYLLRDTTLHVKLERDMGEIDLQVTRDELLGISSPQSRNLDIFYLYFLEVLRFLMRQNRSSST